MVTPSEVVCATAMVSTLFLAACTGSGTPSGGADLAASISDGGAATAASPSVKVVTPPSCEGAGCPIRVPDCGGGPEVHAIYSSPEGSIGTADVDADLQSWIGELFGSGEGRGIPTPPDTIAFAVTSDGHDLGLLFYQSDGQGGWLKKSYVACQAALTH
ncbi:MAG: hypothetical protein ACHQY1_00015 [Myxococcota bacterium]